MEGEDEKPDLKIVHSSGDDEPKADKTTEDTASIIRELTRKFSTLPADQSEVMWAVFRAENFEKAIEQSGLDPDEFRSRYKKANASLYPKQPSDFNIGEVQPDHPSGDRRTAEGPESQGDNVIPFPELPEKQK